MNIRGLSISLIILALGTQAHAGETPEIEDAPVVRRKPGANSTPPAAIPLREPEPESAPTQLVPVDGIKSVRLPRPLPAGAPPASTAARTAPTTKSNDLNPFEVISNTKQPTYVYSVELNGSIPGDYSDLIAEIKSMKPDKIRTDNRKYTVKLVSKIEQGGHTEAMGQDKYIPYVIVANTHGNKVCPTGISNGPIQNSLCVSTGGKAEGLKKLTGFSRGHTVECYFADRANKCN